MFVHPLLTLCFLSYVFFLHHPISAGNILTPHTHFEVSAGILSDYNILVGSDSPHVQTSTLKLVLGFGRPYIFANVVIIVITLLNILVYKLLELQEENSDQKSSSSLNLPYEKQLCRCFLLDEIVSATNNFDDSLVIGKGGFGKVYKGIIDNGSCTVAIKRLNPLSKQGAPEFWTEIKMLSKFRHSHLVSLIGYCDHNNEMILVYEFMIHGSLANHLHKISKNDKSNLSWVQRLKICIGAARGLDYLHTGTAVVERVIHRDVKSSNILLDENWAAKISDFGLSRTGPADQESTHVSTKHIQGTFGYMDPDYFLTRRFTRKSDVYAFGVVLLEVLSERPAVDRSLLDEDQWGLAGWGQQCINDGVSHHLIGPNLKWEILPKSLIEFVQIAGQCLHSRPKKRPTMSEVVAKLELALALQLQTNELMDDDLLSNWPFGSPENTDSYTKDNPAVHVGDPSSKQLSQLETPVVLENIDAKPSDNENNSHNSKIPNKVEDMATTSGKIVTPNLKNFKFSELESATKNFTLDVLGEGGFGRVYKGWVPSEVGGKAVAVKRIMHESVQGLAEGLMEVEILGKFSHPNLVKLLGYHYGKYDDNDPFFFLFDKKENFAEFLLVYEYMQKGSLNYHLFGNVENPLPWDTRLKIAIGAARALSFLHATDNQVIVRDIRTSKILLDGDFNAKLSGLGLARKCPQNEDTHISTEVKGTFGYAAPEYIATGHLRLESDIYGFGVVLLEILTGLRVFDRNRQQGKRNLVDWAEPLLSHKESLKRRLVDLRLENDYPPQGAFKLASLIIKCLQPDPKLRPSMKQVLQTLEQINSTKPKVREVQARNPTVQMDQADAYKFCGLGLVI